MNRIIDLHALPKGTPCEIKGEIIYEKEPKQSRYGKGFNQFIVVSDNPEGGMNTIGVNVTVGSIDDGFLKEERVIITGKVDKYADRTQQLQPDGTYPMKTSVKAEHVEKFVEAEDFPAESSTPEVPQKQVMDKDDVKEADKPAPKSNGYTQAKEEERKMWTKKDLIVAKQSACKTVGRWVESGKIDLKNYFTWATKLVEFFYNEDDAFARTTEISLIKSGLITTTKEKATEWILEHVKETDIAQDMTGILHVKELNKQSLKELIETMEKVNSTLG